VTVTSSVRGNLGPPSVVVQDPPGDDWLRDRWQAASDMHGSAIPGRHFVQLAFPEDVIPTKAILDWEAAYADDYVLEVSSDGIAWRTLYDGADAAQRRNFRSVKESGQSPGVKKKTPLHVVHTIGPFERGGSASYIRVNIRKPAMGWGVSLWQIDVYGFYRTEDGSDSKAAIS